MEFKTVPADSLETVYTGDWHIGNLSTDKVALNEMIKYIRRNGCNWFHLGDACESTGHTNKNFDPRTKDPEFTTIGDEYRYFRKLIKPIAHQCLGIVTGNHDERNAKISEIDRLSEVCEDLEIPYLSDTALVKICYNGSKKEGGTVAYLKHGSTGGRQSGVKINNIENIPVGYVADVYCVGHSHYLSVTSASRIKMSRFGNMCEELMWFGNTGSFMRSVQPGKSSYAEKAGYRPNKIGYIKTIYNPSVNDKRLKMEEVIL